MTYHRYWERRDLERYFPVEAMTKDPDIFSRVHVPIDRIYVDSSKSRRVPHRSEVVQGHNVLVTSEARLVDYIGISEPTDPNRIVMLVGETGSGKSELCQALKYALDGHPTHVAILIYRSRTKLGDIVGAIEGMLGESGPEPVELDRVSPEQFSARMKAELLRYVDSEAGERAFGPNVNTLRKVFSLPLFEDGLQKVYGKYRKEIAQPGGVRLPDLLPLEEFRRLTGAAYQADNTLALHQHPKGGPSATEYIHAQVLPRISDALAQLLRVDDLIAKVRLLSDRFAEQGRRPVLLIEDITTFGFLQSGLLDYMFDLTAGHYDVVLGITTDYERFSQEGPLGPLTTIGDRLDARLLLTQDGRTLFAETQYLELAKRHLQGVVRPPERLPEWWGVFEGCYPLHPLAIARIWQGLQESGSRKQTPRLLLRVVRSVLEDERLPWEPLASLVGSHLREPPVGVVATESMAPEIRGLACWFGLPTRNGVYLPRQMLAAFGIAETGCRVQGEWVILDLAPALRDYYSGVGPPVSATVDVVEVPTGVEEPARTEPDQSEDQGGGDKTPPPPARPDPLVEARRSLVEWLRGAGEFPHREVLARGVWATLEALGMDPFVLRRPGAIAEQGRPVAIRVLTRVESRVTFEGFHQEREVNRLVIPRREQDQVLLEWLLSLGMEEDWGRSRLQSDAGIPIVGLHHYVSQRAQEMQVRAYQVLEEALAGMDVALLVGLGKFLLLNGAGQIATATPAALSCPVGEGGLPVEAPSAPLKDAWNRLCYWSDTVHGLFVANFHLQGSFIDHDLLERCSEVLNDRGSFTELLKQLQRVDAQEAQGNFSVGTAATAFGDTLRALQDYARAVLDWLRQVPSLSLSRTATELEGLLPTEQELARILPLAEGLVTFQESRHLAKRTWQEACTFLRGEEAVRLIDDARSSLAEVQTLVQAQHPAHVICGAVRLRQVTSRRVVGALQELEDLVRDLKDDPDLNVGIGGEQYRCLVEAMRQLRETAA